MNIVISGSTGMIGRALTDYFRREGHVVNPLLRSTKDSNAQGIYWNINAGTIEEQKLEGQDIVIHLAGANISERWTPEYKKIIKSSRVDSTRLLARTIANLKNKPRLFISASAIGYYGNHSANVNIDEDSPVGLGFLPEVCNRWEDETRVAAQAGIRVVNLRFGVVLSKNGGALAKMLPIFNFGLGGVLGQGDQMMSWGSLNEIPLIIQHIIQTQSLSGPLNAVSPRAVTNKVFTRILGEVIKRPVFLPVPAMGIHLLFGEMGKSLLLEGANVTPKRLLTMGYVFKYPDLRSALQDAL